jgi:hypothetical protein
MGLGRQVMKFWIRLCGGIVFSSADWIMTGGSQGHQPDAPFVRTTLSAALSRCVSKCVVSLHVLLAASPIRPERKKSEIAPLFVPRDNTGNLIIMCPKCLRPSRLEAKNLNGGLHETSYRSCGTPVKFEINHEIEPLIKRNDA